MPPPPGNVTGREVQSKSLQDGRVSYRQVHLTFGPGEKLGFDLGIFAPEPTNGVRQPLPTIVSLTISTGTNAVNQYAEALRRGYAVVVINYQQLGADNTNYRQSAFFPAYPGYDWNDIAAWAWGVSRCVDYLQDAPFADKTKIIAHGVSRTGQAVLLAGAFDERIALVAPVGAGCAFRYCGKDRGGKESIDEIVAKVTHWFGPRFPEFRGQVDKLPCDQHWLPALVAPRLFIMSNGLDDPYCQGNALAQTYLGAKPVYEMLGVPDNLGVNFRPGGHGMRPEDWQAVLDFADLHLRKLDVKRRFDQLPSAEQLK